MSFSSFDVDLKRKREVFLLCAVNFGTLFDLYHQAKYFNEVSDTTPR